MTLQESVTLTESMAVLKFIIFSFLKEKLKEASYLRDNRGELIEELTTMIVQTVSNKQLQGILSVVQYDQFYNVVIQDHFCLFYVA